MTQLLGIHSDVVTVKEDNVGLHVLEVHCDGTAVFLLHAWNVGLWVKGCGWDMMVMMVVGCGGGGGLCG